ncbi:MAG: ABC transporter ATP-binding protein [Candidatus Cloacimonetes bacterium]|nr:ABC transporter ATP-binding protein [Candidatus Cloacimonadota bacterium]
MKDILRIYQIMLQHWGYLLIGLIAMLGYAAFSGASLTMVVPLFDYVFKPTQGDVLYNNSSELIQALRNILTNNLSSNSFLEIVINSELQNSLLSALKNVLSSTSSFLLLKIVSAMVIVMILLKNLFFYLNRIMFLNLHGKTIEDIRNQLFEKYMSLSLSFFSKNKVGDSLVRMINDVDIVSNNLIVSVMGILRDIILIVVFVYIAIFLNLRLFLISMIIFPIFAYLVTLLGKKVKKHSKRIQSKISDMFSQVEEVLTNIKIIKAYNQEDNEVKKFRKINNSYFLSWIRAENYGSLNVPISEVTSAIAGASVLMIGGYEVIKGTGGFTLGNFTAFLLALFSVLHPLKVISRAYSNIKKAMVSLNRISEVLNLEPQIIEIENPILKDDFVDSISLKNVNFSYDGTTNVLTDISLDIKKGEKIAFVGSSGAGKTTLANVIARLYDTTSGKLTIDGVSIKHISIKSLRKLFGLVTQDSILFSDTIFNNLTFNNDKENYEQKVIEALEIANATDFVKVLPNGIHEHLHAKGHSFSGGQRQRLCIARAVVNDPPILIFDEATSSLDTESEKNVQLALEKATSNRTVIIIAHRLSTVLSCDRIFVMDKGRIICSGTHKELLDNCERYRHLYNIQFDN